MMFGLMRQEKAEERRAMIQVSCISIVSTDMFGKLRKSESNYVFCIYSGD